MSFIRLNDRLIMSSVLTKLLTAVGEMFDLPSGPELNISRLNVTEIMDVYGALDLTSLVPAWESILKETLTTAIIAGM